MKRYGYLVYRMVIQDKRFVLKAIFTSALEGAIPYIMAKEGFNLNNKFLLKPVQLRRDYVYEQLDKHNVYFYRRWMIKRVAICSNLQEVRTAKMLNQWEGLEQ